MPKWCSIGVCSNHHLMVDESGKQKFRFFKFPNANTAPERRSKWAQACGRYKPGTREIWHPPEHVVGVYVCSDHFVTGKPSKIKDHPDYVPNTNLTKTTVSEAASGSLKMRRYSSAMKRKFKVPVSASKSKKVPKTSDITSDDDEEVLAGIEPLRPLSDEEDVVSNKDDQVKCSSGIESSSKSEPLTAKHTVILSDSDQHLVYHEVAELQKERDELKAEMEMLRARLNTLRLGVHTIDGNDSKATFYTGLTWDVFITTYETLAEKSPGKGVPILSYVDQFFFTLVKLKHNMKFEYLADQAGISTSSMIDIFWKWINIIHTKLDWLISWPSRDYAFQTIPPQMKALFPRLTCIIDCFEIFVEAPSNLKARAQLWSNYKKHTTIKFLIGCTSLGAVSFLSNAWGGRVSDVEIVKQSGFLTRPDHMPGDQILADRGFKMQDEFAAVAGVELLMPAFIKGLKQFSAKDVETSRQLASVRIHIERVIGGIKNRFAILQGTLSMRLIKSLKDEADECGLSCADKIVRVCSILYNLAPSIVYNE